MKKIRWGIIGPGKIARKFANDFNYVLNAELTAVASRSEERANEFAKEFNVPKASGSYADIYNDSEVDAIYVATTHNFHFDICSDALKAGKPVLSEKPITTNVHEFEQLKDIADSNNVYLVEGLWTYFLPAVKKAREWFDKGLIGDIVNIKSEFGYLADYNPDNRLYNPDLAGGSILDIGIYNLAISRLFLGEHYNDINIVAQKAPTGVDDDVNMLVDYGGRTANLHCSFRSNLNNWTYIYGTEGVIAMKDFWQSKEVHLIKNREQADHFVDDNPGIGFNYEITEVSKEIESGLKQSLVMPHSTSLFLQKQMESILSTIHK